MFKLSTSKANANSEVPNVAASHSFSPARGRFHRGTASHYLLWQLLHQNWINAGLKQTLWFYRGSDLSIIGIPKVRSQKLRPFALRGIHSVITHGILRDPACLITSEDKPAAGGRTRLSTDTVEEILKQSFGQLDPVWNSSSQMSQSSKLFSSYVFFPSYVQGWFLNFNSFSNMFLSVCLNQYLIVP